MSHLFRTVRIFFDLQYYQLFVIKIVMKFAFGYLRVSTDEQTVLNQKLAIEKWAEDNDYKILDFFEDSAISGKILAIDRAAFKEMLTLVRSDHVDSVIVYELSRVGRTFWETLDAIKAIEQYSPLISCSPKEIFLQTKEHTMDGFELKPFIMDIFDLDQCIARWMIHANLRFILFPDRLGCGK